MNILLISLEQSLVFLPLVFGMYLSYRILKITDLTVDGTYVLGGAVFARTLEYGVLLAMLFAVIAGIVVGKIVALMQRHNQVNDLIVGVLASFMLYSINLQILGRPNISLLDKPNLLTIFGITNWIIILVIIGISLIVVLVILLNSKFGLLLRAFGQDQKLLSILGKHAEKYRIFGLALSNMLASITGVLAAQINGFADINMGFGVALVGIGAIVIGVANKT
jgi:putative ABC transport system permease protein